MAVAKLRQIDNQVTRITSMVESSISASLLDVEITPDIARALLRYNRPGLGGTNRKLRQTDVAYWASLMRDGQWVNTGEPIILSDDGILNDGQHRLAAVVLAETSALMDIRFGVPRRVFLSTGVGRMRTAVDALIIAGYPSQSQLSGCCRMIISYQKGLPSALHRRVRPDEVIDLMQRHPDIVEALTFLQYSGKRLRVAALQAVAWFAMHSANEATVAGFFDILRYAGEEEEATSKKTAAHQLYEALWSGRGFGHDAYGRTLTMAVAIQSWNAYLRNERVKAWWEPGQAFPKMTGLKL